MIIFEFHGGKELNPMEVRCQRNYSKVENIRRKTRHAYCRCAFIHVSERCSSLFCLKTAVLTPCFPTVASQTGAAFIWISCLGGYSVYFMLKKNGVNITALRQTGLQRLPDTWTPPHEQCGGMSCLMTIPSKCYLFFFQFFLTFEYKATTGFHYIKFFPFVKLRPWLYGLTAVLPQ